MDISNEQVLEKDLNRICIGLYKIQANLAKFSKKVNVFHEDVPMQKNGHLGRRQPPPSYVEVVKGKTSKHEKQYEIAKKGGSQEVQATPSLVFTSCEKDKAWLKECWYGEVFSIEDLLRMEYGLKESSVQDCSIQYLGGKGTLESRSFVENSLLVKHTPDNIAELALGADGDQAECQEGGGDLAVELSFLIRKRTKEPGPDACKVLKTYDKSVEMALVSCGSGDVGYMKGLQEAQNSNAGLELEGRAEGSMGSKIEMEIAQNEKVVKGNSPYKSSRTRWTFPPTNRDTKENSRRC
ncbi:hypothetical protein Ancab_038730 [Ancistrocladus abbreviatus]